MVNKADRFWTPERKEELLTMFRNGEVGRDIGKHFGMLPSSVRQAAIRYGMTLEEIRSAKVAATKSNHGASRARQYDLQSQKRMDFPPIEGEEWRIIPGSPVNGAYMASNMGRILGPQRILKPQIHQLGYRIVRVVINGKPLCKTIHSLIALTFLGPRPGKLDIAHANNDKTDNRLENLRYCTRRENLSDGWTPDRKFWGPPVKFDRDEMSRLFREIGNQNEIARIMGCGKSTVNRHIRMRFTKEELRELSKNETTNNRLGCVNKRTKEIAPEVMRLVGEGHTVKQIMKMAKVGHLTIKDIRDNPGKYGL